MPDRPHDQYGPDETPSSPDRPRSPKKASLIFLCALLVLGAAFSARFLYSRIPATRPRDLWGPWPHESGCPGCGPLSVEEQWWDSGDLPDTHPISRWRTCVQAVDACLRTSPIGATEQRRNEVYVCVEQVSSCPKECIQEFRREVDNSWLTQPERYAFLRVFTRTGGYCVPRVPE